MLGQGAPPHDRGRTSAPPSPGLGTLLMRRKPVERLVAEGGQDEGGALRTFRAPLSPVLPAVGFALCVWMMSSLSAVTWVVFGVWMAVGLVFYFVYGHRRSRLATPAPPEK